jgi:hypothetical protein
MTILDVYLNGLPPVAGVTKNKIKIIFQRLRVNLALKIMSLN